MGRWPGSHEKQLAAVHIHRISRGQLATPPGFDGAIHPHITPLNAQLGFTSSAHQALVFEELVEFQGAA
jgi:hypothetical protein